MIKRLLNEKEFEKLKPFCKCSACKLETECRQCSGCLKIRSYYIYKNGFCRSAILSEAIHDYSKATDMGLTDEDIERHIEGLQKSSDGPGLSQNISNFIFVILLFLIIILIFAVAKLTSEGIQWACIFLYQKVFQMQ